MEKIKTISLWVLGIGIVASWFFFASDKSHTPNALNMDMYPIENIARNYEPNHNDLYDLYLENMMDTVILLDKDTTVAILKVEIIKSWKPHIKR